MRLRKIRLAGFKSFVDPTPIVLPGDLISVVGPNGCGKSNIIDAVRWVMGEVSAKHLRGETMADVVFNGSTARKPVGQASVELVFDNSDGRLGGRYAAYAEISVRRQVGRDGQSAYFLNGTRCRRRDVMDVFLGTGLGPRSYSIIEQGMISRVVEARPEDLREFLEEAAGISKYRERRRDTEHRIRHTEENLERLGDLREELGRRLAHLQRQARAAERYKELKERERAVAAELQGLRWRALDREAEAQGARRRDQETKLEAALAALRRSEAEAEHKRAEHGTASERYNERYREVLDAGAAIARSEQAIQSLRERRAELESRRERDGAELVGAREELASIEERHAALAAELERERPELEAAEAGVDAARTALDAGEAAMQSWQSRFESLSEAAAAPERDIHAERARGEQLRDSTARLEERIAALDDERSALADAGAAVDLDALEAAAAAAGARAETLGAELGSARERIQSLRDEAREGAAELHRLRERQQALSGRLASLQALQQQALRPQDGPLAGWIESHGLSGAPRLAERVDADGGWDQALESVLSGRLGAIVVDSLDGWDRALESLDEGAVTLVEAHDGSDPPPAAGLAAQVRAPVALDSLLAEVRPVDSLATALGERSRLTGAETLVTPRGDWIGRNWVRVSRGADDRGVLAREQTIRDLLAEGAALATEVERCTEHAAARERAQREAEERLATAQAEYDEVGRELTRASAALAAGRARAEEADERARSLAEERRRLGERYASECTALEDSANRLAAAERLAGERGSERDRWVRERDEHRARLEAARAAWQQARQDGYERGLRVEGLSTRIAALVEAGARERRRVDELERRVAEANEVLARGDAPIEEARQRLDEQRVERQSSEQALEQARAAVEILEGEVREIEGARRRAEATVADERDALEQIRVGAEEVRVRRETIEEQLRAAGFEVAEVLASLDEDGDAESREQELEGIARRIARLGPINLAAIDEREQVAERKGYLDQQHQDLTDALETLESAIRKIDRETRARFKETYERVNEGLGTTFPRLFGGGHAELQMTGDDLLDTGIAITARPPGKRNSNIQQLSGGEKALTAVALVFAIFELNPAPFCLLDEVDAPLDDANVVRFCELVKDMSERVQFVIVTHNKVTMEICHQLIGVTMNEPGVSRLVAVDIDEAVAMAAS